MKKPYRGDYKPDYEKWRRQLTNEFQDFLDDKFNAWKALIFTAIAFLYWLSCSVVVSIIFFFFPKLFYKFFSQDIGFFDIIFNQWYLIMVGVATFFSERI